MNRAEILMGKRTRRPRLVQEPAARGFIAGSALREKLQRHITVELFIHRAVDNTHGTGSATLHDPVVGDGGPDHACTAS